VLVQEVLVLEDTRPACVSGAGGENAHVKYRDVARRGVMVAKEKRTRLAGKVDERGGRGWGDVPKVLERR
jgi:hypothetical protein